VRLREADQVIVGNNTVGPYLRAYSAGFHWIPRPPNPESGDGLWLLAWPLVHAASSLVELMQLRMGLGGGVAPAAFGAVWGLLDDRTSRIQRWSASLCPWGIGASGSRCSQEACSPCPESYGPVYKPCAARDRSTASPRWRVHAALGPAEARAWVSGRAIKPRQIGAALDWAGALHPGRADASTARWWSMQ
jgi:hypothetical protein